jgi:addiction module HigA family antidote
MTSGAAALGGMTVTLLTWKSLTIIEQEKTPMTRNKMRPIAPGEVVRAQLDELNMSANALAGALHVPTNRITGILNGTRALTPETALRLERFFRGTTAQFWLNLQMNFDLRKAEIAKPKDIGAIRPLKTANA